VGDTIAEVQHGISDETGYKSNIHIEIYMYQAPNRSVLLFYNML